MRFKDLSQEQQKEEIEKMSKNDLQVLVAETGDQIKNQKEVVKILKSEFDWLNSLNIVKIITTPTKKWQEVAKRMVELVEWA